MKRYFLLSLGALAVALPANAGAQEASDATSATARAVGTGLEVKSLALDCATLINQHNNELGEVKAWEGVGNKLGVLATAIEAGNDARQGKYIAAGQAVGMAGVDQAICSALSEMCPAYMAGKSIGSLLVNNIPLLLGSDRTLNDMWTDTLAGWVYGTEPTDSQLRAMIAKQQQKLHQLEVTANKTVPNTCSDAERKNAIDDILAKAKARAAGESTIDSDPGLVSDTSGAAANAAAAAGAATSSQLQGLANSEQAASAAMQARIQSQALQRSTSTPFTPGCADGSCYSHQPQVQKPCLQWGRDYVDIAGPGGGWQTVCIRWGN